MRALRKLLLVVVALAIAYAAFAVSAYLGQRKLLFPAPKSAVEPVMDGGSLTKVQGQHGRTVYAFYVPAGKGAPTIVHFHGNAEELADLVPLAWSFHRSEIGFFAVEYPGYGLARDYQPSEEALYADAEAALWHLTNGLGVPVTEVVLEGQSLGSGVAVEMARRGHGSRLILISPYTSIPDLAARTIPILPVRYLVRDRFENLQKAKDLAIPVLVVHGTDDEVIPFDMGERTAQAFPNGSLYKVQGGHHNDLFVHDGRVLVDHIIEFAKGEYGGR